MKMENQEYSDDEKFQGKIQGSCQLDTIQKLYYPFTNLAFISHRTFYQDQYGSEQLSIGKGTGCLIEKNVILTCCHNVVYKRKDAPNFIKVKKQEITIFVGLNGTKDKAIQCKVLQIKFHQQFATFNEKIKTFNRKYDYAVLLIAPKDQKINLNISTIPLTLYEPTQDSKYVFELYGYHAQQNFRRKGDNYKEYQLFGCQGEVWKIEGDFLKYLISTGEGQSGAPIITYCRQGVCKIIGIHVSYCVGEGLIYNQALKITKDMISNIKKWLGQWQDGQITAIKQLLVAKTHLRTNQQLKKRKSNKKTKIQSIHQEKNPQVKDNYHEKEIAIVKQKIQLIQKQGKQPMKDTVIKTQMAQNIENKPKDIIIESITNTFDIRTFNSLKLTQVQMIEGIYFQKRVVDMQPFCNYCRNLKSIVANKCNIQFIPECINGLKELKTVNFNNNYIKQIRDVFAPYLEQLHLDNNRIQKIPEEINKSKYLKWLSVRNNQLRQIHINAWELKMLFVLNLANNQGFKPDKDLKNYIIKRKDQNKSQRRQFSCDI